MKKVSKLKFVGKIAFYGIFAVVLIVVLLMFISKMTNQVFFLGDKTYLWILTDSMEDEIPAQSYIVVRKADPSEVKLGDVISFYSDDPALGGAINTHRVTDISDDGSEFTTKGDNSRYNENDKYTAKADKLVGIYERNSPALTLLGRFFATPAGIFVTLGIIILLTLGIYLPEILRKKKATAQVPIEAESDTTAKKNIGEGSDRATLEEDIKRKAIEDYLRSQAEAQDAPEQKNEADLNDDNTA